jgi:hypothetical protein
MKKVTLSFLVLLFIAFAANSNPAKVDNNLLGSWTFSITQAPWEYSRGNIVFEVGEGKAIAGKLKFVNGLEAKIINVTQADGKIAWDITAEGYVLKTVVTLKDNEITGHIQIPDGNIPFTAKKEVKEK